MKEKSQLTSFDKDFFQNLEPRALTKGGIVGYHRQKALSKISESNQGDKPWKKHNNIKKKEKLRRLTKHFDQND